MHSNTITKITYKYQNIFQFQVQHFTFCEICHEIKFELLTILSESLDFTISKIKTAMKDEKINQKSKYFNKMHISKVSISRNLVNSEELFINLQRKIL